MKNLESSAMPIKTSTKLTLIISILIIFAVLAWRFFTIYDTPNVGVLQGQIEAQQYYISAKVPGRVDKIFVRKGDLVKAGDPIFTLISPELQAKLDQAKAGQAAANANRQEVYKGARIEQINAAREDWLKAKAAAVLAQKTYQRIDSLYEEGVVAEQKRDEAKASANAATHTESAANQAYQLVLAGSRDGEKVAATEKEKAAAGAVAEVEAYFEDTQIFAHQNGEISQVSMHSGELAPAGFPVVTLIDMQDAWALLQVQENLLTHFTIGKIFHVAIPGLGTKQYPFKVTYIAAMGDYATQRTTKPGRGYDMKTFEVELRPLESISNIRAGMSIQMELK